MYGVLCQGYNPRVGRYWPLSIPTGPFSNRPVGVKRFQTIHCCSVDVFRGLVLLFGIGTKALVWGFCSQEVYAGRRIFSFVGFFVR